MEKINVSKHVNTKAMTEAFKGFSTALPYPHCVIDDFFDDDFAKALEEEFPDFDSDAWHIYDNAIEVKKTCNNWNLFPAKTYSVFEYFNSPEFLEALSGLAGTPNLYPDPGLNGGGWHIHKPGGKLNIHLDYNLHPKLGLQRKLNILVYMNSNWQDSWGGRLGLWEHNAEEGRPGALVKEIVPVFNRAVIFDTTCNSWHGLPEPVLSPEGECRQSLAAYFLTIPPPETENRAKALFAPNEDQKDDPAVLELIRKRSSVDTAQSVYKNN